MSKFNLDEFGDFGETAAESKAAAPKKAVKKKAAKPAEGPMPMMNIRFSPENYRYMREEAAIRGLSVTKFTNWIIDEYRQDKSHVHVNPLYQNEAEWK